MVEHEVLSCGYSFHATRFVQSSHQLNAYLIRLQSEGHCTISANRREWLIEAGDLIMLAPGSVYELRVEGKHADDPPHARIVSGDYYLFCQGAWTEQWWGRSPRPARTRIDLNDNLLYLWRQIISEKNGSVHENAELLNYLFRSFCLFLDKALAEPSPRDHNMFTASRMKRFIQRNVHRSFKVEDVANYVELSVSRASRIFKTCFGKTMTEYALDLRLQSAVDRMMYTTMTLEEIAESCGFGSYTFFHKAFKAKFGLSPAAFRNQSK
jgi:AraC family transcriptional regulator of arabinose operon